MRMHIAVILALIFLFCNPFIDTLYIYIFFLAIYVDTIANESAMCANELRQILCEDEIQNYVNCYFSMYLSFMSNTGYAIICFFSLN